MKFLLSTTLLASLSNLALALPSLAAPQEPTSVQTDIEVIDDSLASYNFTPAFTSSLDDLFALLDSIPNSVLESGDDALNQWFIDNDLRDPSSAADLLVDAATPDTTPSLDLSSSSDDLDLVERGVAVLVVARAASSAWKIAKCVSLPLCSLLPPHRRSRRQVAQDQKVHQGAGRCQDELVKLLLGATTKAEKLKAGGKMLVYLSAELLGISSVKAACF